MKLKKELLVIALIMFTEILGWSLILPFLPYMVLDFGATPLTVGLILSSFSIFQFISAPIMGKLSDKYGRKPMLLLSQVSTLAGFLILGFANSIKMIILSRVVDGLIGSNMTISRAYITDITKGKNRTKTFGYLSAVFGLGMFIGPAIGGFLATIDYSIPSFIAAFFSLVSIILTIIFLKETVKREKNARLKLKYFIPARYFFYGLKIKKLRSLFLELAVYLIGFTIFTSSMALFVNSQLNLGPADVGMAMMIVGLARITFQLTLMPKMINKFSDENLTRIGLFLVSTGLLLMWFVNNRLGLYTVILLFSIGAGLSRPTINTRVSKHAGKNERGKVMGVVDSIGSISQIIGPFVGGLIIENFYPGFLGIISAGFVLTALFIDLIYSKKVKNVGLKS